MKTYTAEEFLKMGWGEEELPLLLEQQEQLQTSSVKIRIEDVTTEDEDFLLFIEEQKNKGSFNLEITDADMESYVLWVKGCDYALEIDKCALTDKNEKRYIIKNISKETYFIHEKLPQTTIVKEATIIYDEEDAFSTLEFLNECEEDAYVLIEY